MHGLLLGEISQTFLSVATVLYTQFAVGSRRHPSELSTTEQNCYGCIYILLPVSSTYVVYEIERCILYYLAGTDSPNIRGEVSGRQSFLI